MRIRLILIVGLLLMSLCAISQEKKLNTSLDHVTMFFEGAELTHTTKSVDLNKGENVVILEGLSPNIDVNSIKVKTTNNVIVSSHEFSITFLSEEKALSPKLKIMEDSIKFYQNSIKKLDIDIKINTEMLTHLKEGVSKNISGSEEGLGIDELVKTMNYFKTKSEELENKSLEMNDKRSKMYNDSSRLSRQLALEKTKNTKTVGSLKLTLAAPMSTTSIFTVTYYTNAANWNPYYDINVTSINNPITITSKAKVQQTTGLDWDKVKLTLSTATPSSGKIAPLFNAWFLREQRRMAAEADQVMLEEVMTQNTYSYRQEKQAIANPTVRGAEAVDSYEPLYIIDGIPATQATMDALDPNSIKSVNVIKDATATQLYGSRGANGVIVITTKSSMDDYVSRSDNMMNMVYNIDLPYSISGSGKTQNIDLQTNQVDAKYKYYCVPKLDSETYLIAEIENWQRLGLHNGNANITYDGTYVGESYIDAESTHENLTLTLGTDKRVSVKRENIQDYSSSRRLFGNDVQNIFTYKITVKNNQAVPIKMVLKDQYPITTERNIEVILRKETTPWSANKEDVGVISWEEDFKAGEIKEYIISYSVKYPKNMNLNL